MALIRGVTLTEKQKEKHATLPVAGAAVTSSTQAAGRAQIQRLWPIPVRAAVSGLLELAYSANADMDRTEHSYHSWTAGQYYVHSCARVLLSNGKRGGK